MFIEIVYPYVLYISIPFLLCIALWRWYWHKKPLYVFSSLLPFKELINYKSNWQNKILYSLRLFSLLSMIFSLARLRIPDEKSKIPVKGVDIMLVLDLSDSMQLFDDENDRRTRFEVAKTEALSFINKRENDPIGLVFFGAIAISRCPLTLDKHILNEILDQTNIGFINQNGTVISRGILTAINRLKNSTAKSKIIIVLTDGQPTPGDIDPKICIEMAKKLSIKIYTIGIGSDHGGFINHPFYGFVQVPTPLNISLLQAFAEQTGGKFFRAQSPDDVAAVYNTIDQLERTEYQIPIYARYYELFMFFLWLSLILLVIEISLTSLFWLGL